MIFMLTMMFDAEAARSEFKNVKRFDGKANGQRVNKFLARVEALTSILL
jgi:hypothetical protein